jgi:hypothetical protein
MQTGTTLKAHLSWPPVVRLVLLVFVAAALFLQSYATQTHIHPQTHLVVASAHADYQNKSHQPVGDDTDNCPLCHSLYSGQYITPSLAATFLPILAVSIIDVSYGAVLPVAALSHSWRGRGPPHT